MIWTRLASRFAFPLRNVTAGSSSAGTGAGAGADSGSGSGMVTMVSDALGLSLITKRKHLAELAELRAIFKDCLPVGEKTDQVEDYFNSLEKVISTNDYQSNPNPLRRETFDHDNPDVQYTYLSDSLLKEQSSRPVLRAISQDVDHQSDLHARQVPQLGPPVHEHPPRIPECEADGFAEYGHEDSDDSGW